MRIPGINKVRAKGRIYYYWRATGERIHAAPGTPEFFAEIAALKAKTPEPAASKPGTLGRAVEAYRSSPFWAALRPKTRLSYDRAFAVLEPIGGMPLVDLTPGFVARLRDKQAPARRRWMTNYTLTVLSLVSDFAVENEWMSANPTAKIRKIPRSQDEPDANRPWSQKECRTVLDEAPPYLRVPIALAMLAGFRKGDVLTAAKTAISDGKIFVRTRKRNRLVGLPIHPTLANVLANAPKHQATTIAANSYGEPWTESGFNSTFCKFIRKMEVAGKVEPGLTMHGLRHTLGTRLKEAGAEDGDIADILGQKTTAMARHYSDQADTSEKSRGLIEAADIFGAGRKRPDKRATNSSAAARNAFKPTPK